MHVSHSSAARARSPDITATPDLDAPHQISEDISTALSHRFVTTPLRHEDVAVALEEESSASSGRRASLNPTQSLAMPLFSSMKVTILF